MLEYLNSNSYRCEVTRRHSSYVVESYCIRNGCIHYYQQYQNIRYWGYHLPPLARSHSISCGELVIALALDGINVLELGYSGKQYMVTGRRCRPTLSKKALKLFELQETEKLSR